MRMERDDLPASDKELWRRLAVGSTVEPRPVDEMAFAAWIDGRLGEDESAQIEAAVAAAPEMRRAALEIADILGKPLPMAPERMVVRAHALVGFDAERRVARGGLLHRWLSWAAPYALQRAAVTIAAVVIAAGGFTMGGGLGTSVMRQQQAQTSSNQKVGTPSDISTEISEFFASDGI
jgi:hypothetical protein